MKVKFDPVNSKPKIILEKKDVILSDIRSVTELTASAGWKVIEKHHRVARIQIEERAKSVSLQDGKSELCAKLCACLAGFDLFVETVWDLEKAHSDYLESKKKERLEEKQEVNEFND
jgi:hypothetical protein